MGITVKGLVKGPSGRRLSELPPGTYRGVEFGCLVIKFKSGECVMIDNNGDATFHAATSYQDEYVPVNITIEVQV